MRSFSSMTSGRRSTSRSCFYRYGHTSCAWGTSRPRGLVPSAMVIELGALPLSKAEVLLLRVPRASHVDMPQPACDVAEACGRMPLLLAILCTFMEDRLPRRCLTEDYAREVTSGAHLRAAARVRPPRKGDPGRALSDALPLPCRGIRCGCGTPHRPRRPPAVGRDTAGRVIVRF